jgi:predicted ABC-type transport system involved in lysophospholipase L1 biosynthesis ATPase subunit
MTTPYLLEMRALTRAYQGLRPLRVRELQVAPGAVLHLTGFDAEAAEMFVHLLTGAALPDEGDVRLFGVSTRDITDAEGWLRSLDALGLVSHRAVLVDMLSVRQNMAMPLTLQIDPMSTEVRAQVDALAREAGVPEAVLDRPLGSIDPETHVRVRFARALAQSPTLIVAEHPTVGVPREAVAGLARDVAAVARRRQAALLTLTADPDWAGHAGGNVLTLSAKTGELVPGGSFLDRVRRALGGG